MLLTVNLIPSQPFDDGGKTEQLLATIAGKRNDGDMAEKQTLDYRAPDSSYRSGFWASTINVVMVTIIGCTIVLFALMVFAFGWQS